MHSIEHSFLRSVVTEKDEQRVDEANLNPATA